MSEAQHKTYVYVGLGGESPLLVGLGRPASGPGRTLSPGRRRRDLGQPLSGTAGPPAGQGVVGQPPRPQGHFRRDS